jgi:hypothetical protein
MISNWIIPHWPKTHSTDKLPPQKKNYFSNFLYFRILFLDFFGIDKIEILERKKKREAGLGNEYFSQEFSEYKYFCWSLQNYNNFKDGWFKKSLMLSCFED